MSTQLETGVSQDFKVEERLPRLHKPDHRNVIIRCAVAILLTLCVMEGFARFTVSIGVPNMGPTEDFDRAYLLAKQPAAKGKQLIAVVGGSFSRRAVYSEYIEKCLAKEGYNVEVRNLSTVACSSHEQLALLDRLTKNAGTPVLVIADFRPLAYVSNYLKRTVDYEKLRFDESYLGRRYELAAKKDLISKLQDFAETNVYLIGYRRTLRYTLLAWTSLLFDSERFRTKRLRRTSESGQSPHGWSPVYEIADSEELARGTKGYEERVKTVAQLCSPPPIAYTDEYSKPLRDFCSSKQIPLMYVWEPVHPSMGSIYSDAGVPLSDFVRQLQNLTKYQNTFVFDAHDIDSDSDHFKNIDHVNFRGALVFSEGLAQHLSRSPVNRFLNKSIVTENTPTLSRSADDESISELDETKQ